MKRTTITTKIVFALYGAVLVWIVMGKMAFSVADIPWQDGVRAINLEPFRHSIIAGRYLTSDTVLNVLIFLPLGAYLWMLGMPAVGAVLCSGLVSVGFEVCQYALASGVSDVTDVITNTAGALIGVLFYAVARLILPNKRKRDALVNGIAIVGLMLFAAWAIWLYTATF